MSQTQNIDEAEVSGDSDDERAVRETLAESFEPITSSKQAKFYEKNGQSFEAIRNHYDGAHFFREFETNDGKTPSPFYKALHAEQRALRNGHVSQILTYPDTYLNAVLHLSDQEKHALEQNDLEFFESASRTRQGVIRFLAENPEYLDAIETGGKDILCHAKPGRGKTSFMLWEATIQNAEINDETVIWALTLDELEVLPLAPVMTLFVPEGVTITATAKPADWRLPSVEIALDDVFREVVTYSDPTEIFEKVVPGGIYGVLPDPHFRECERLVGAKYLSAWDAEEDEKDTPLRDFIHALLEVRAKRDVYLHHTTLVIDEYGDLVPENPEDNYHEEKDKVNEYPKRMGKMRKKNGSIVAAAHSLFEPAGEILDKQRWFATFPRTPVPSSSRRGIDNVPLPKEKPRKISTGTAFVWDENNYVEVSWPNPYSRSEWFGEIDIRYPRMEAQK